ncbi:MAG: nuclear transport factor 2 family protein [Dehalococcoidia bacterium]|nr:nuclear transport factor 2 family protein [Dehalococcoidia bacterium]MCA9851464.1 nuclear transport factor 2 family protein [Dehalococcoidia bacterium]MCA9856410.1 nuclear transport factor 2 family protein [Dehalococcoidia bacterium]MCB9483679.1 nuclear transport factor 2 family protein [Dehalococcoidia bacterium]MCB9491119.1 nuclear transport factor 2 family protein [Dehalococcoidia bacterium]
MNEGQRSALRARGQEFIRTFIGIAEGSRDLIEALNRVLEPGARVHLQNGDIVPPDVSTRHAASAELVFPDLEIEFEEGLFPDDRVVVRVRMTGTSSGRTPFVPKGGTFDVTGAFIARITPEMTISELWSYLNPGFGFAFPPRGVRLTPPAPDGATESASRSLYDAWVRGAEAGRDFVSSVADTLAPAGVVHLGNGDVTQGDGLDDLFARIAAGLHDLSIEIEDVMFDGAFVVSPFRMSGIHGGPIGMLAPTGRVLPSTGAMLARADAAGRAAEVWLYLAPAYAVTFPPGRR